MCGCSSMVEPQPSKLVAWVRFPSPAPFTKISELCASSSAGYSTALLRRVSGVRIPSGVPYLFYGGYSSVGRAPDCGSGSRGFESHYSPHLILYWGIAKW